MAETPKLRPLIYLDDVLQTGKVEIEEVPVSPDDPLFDPDGPSILSGLHDCFVNGRLAHPVGPAVIDMNRQTIIWRFKTTHEFPRLVPSPRGGHHREAENDPVTTEDLMPALQRFFVWALIVVGVSYVVMICARIPV